MDKPNTNTGLMARLSIIILNWNGWQDTIACLQSLSKSTYHNFDIILVDNASADDSLEQINKWIQQHNNSGTERKFATTESAGGDLHNNEFIRFDIIRNTVNHGFAKGNNIGMEVALKNNCDFVLLLNNDTIVEETSLENLIVFFDTHPSYSAATPQIRYFDKPDLLWNCGGKLTWLGSRKYFYNDKSQSELPKKEHLDITFITGCALMIKTEVLQKYGLLSESFFFGEEDYEFSMRMKRANCKMACVLSSVIYHKVNSSIAKASSIITGKIYIHYLNRFINLRSYMSPATWQLWRHVYLLYIFVLLKFRHKITCRVIRRFNRSLLRDSILLTEVNKATFEKYIKCNFDVTDRNEP